MGGPTAALFPATSLLFLLLLPLLVVDYLAMCKAVLVPGAASSGQGNDKRSNGQGVDENDDADVVSGPSRVVATPYKRSGDRGSGPDVIRLGRTRVLPRQSDPRHVQLAQERFLARSKQGDEEVRVTRA